MLQDGSLVSKYEFGSRASDEQIARAAKALEANGIGVLIAEDGEAARRMFFELIPEGSEVFLGASVTLEQLGIKEVVDKSGRYAALRPKMFAMNKETQAREIRKLGAAPDYAAGSVQAVTEDGQVLVASKTGSQIGPYASGAGKVVWVVGAQKIVPNLDEAFRRLHEHSVPMEEQLMQERYNTGTYIGKILIVNREMRPNRITMIIVKKEIGH
jgi:L-lactate utilization protein LutC